MKLIVNSNRIVAALIKNSSSRKIILEGKVDLIAINDSEKEIQKYKQDILEKSKLTESQFNSIYERLKEKLIILDDRIIQINMEEAKNIMDHIDRDDTPFIAAAIATKSNIWSDDKHFEKQDKIKVWKTKEIITKFINNSSLA